MHKKDSAASENVQQDDFWEELPEELRAAIARAKTQLDKSEGIPQKNHGRYKGAFSKIVICPNT